MAINPLSSTLGELVNRYIERQCDLCLKFFLFIIYLVHDKIILIDEITFAVLDLWHALRSATH